MKRRSIFSITFWGLLASSTAWVPGSIAADLPVAQSEVSSVEEVRLLRFRAMVGRDLDALDHLLTDDVTYSHTTGWVESKASFLDTVGSGLIDYVSAEPHSIDTRFFGDVAVANGLADMKVVYQNEDREFTIRFLEVYRMEQGVWRLTAWQSVMNTTDR